MEIVFTLGFPFFFVAIVVGVIALAMRQQRRARENLARLAASLGLQVQQPAKKFFLALDQPRATGSVGGRAVEVFAYSTGSGKHRTQWVAVKVPAQNPGGLTLRISAENLFTRAGRVFGIEDVQFGDPPFDAKFFVKSNDTGYVRAALLPETRLKLLESWKRGARGTIHVDGGEVRYAEMGTFSNAKICDRFPALVELACELAVIVETHR